MRLSNMFTFFSRWQHLMEIFGQPITNETKCSSLVVSSLVTRRRDWSHILRIHGWRNGRGDTLLRRRLRSKSPSSIRPGDHLHCSMVSSIWEYNSKILLRFCFVTSSLTRMALYMYMYTVFRKWFENCAIMLIGSYQNWWSSLQLLVHFQIRHDEISISELYKNEEITNDSWWCGDQDRCRTFESLCRVFQSFFVTEYDMTMN